ncbi:MAG: hypothetical protein LUE17_00275 [Planctomycetaceae bacterium]|nr:hypothetical protein [Planctomycetaceae bacterium]
MSTNQELAVRNGHTARERALLLQLDCDPVAARQKRAHCQHDAGNHILDANCVYDAGVFELFCLPASPDLFTVRFTAPQAYAAGETVRIGDDDYQVRTVDGVAAPDGVFAAGAVVRCDVDREQGIVFFAGVAAADGMGRDEIEDALAEKADRTAGFIDCDSQTVAGVIELTPRTPVTDPLPEMLTLRFAADAACEDGCVVRFNGVAYPLYDSTKAALKAGAFAAGAMVDIHLHEGNAFFNRGVGDGSGPGVNPGINGWNVSTGDDAVSVTVGIHVQDAVTPTRIVADTSFPVKSQLVDAAISLNTGLYLLENGTVLSCGLNQYGHLGREGAGRKPLDVIPNLTDIKAVDAGNTVTFFLKQDGTVYSCGYSNYGHLGRVNESNGDKVNLEIVPIPKKVKKVNCAWNSTYFLCEDGTVWSCGSNTLGELGRNVKSGTASEPQ